MNRVFVAENFRFFLSKTWRAACFVSIVVSLFMIFSISRQANWRQNLIQSNQQIEREMHISDKRILNRSQDTSILIWKQNKMYLDNHKTPPVNETFWGYISNLLSIRGLGLIFIVFPILFASRIANDYEKKSINFSMISPITRKNFFWGQLASVIFVVSLYLFFILAINALVASFYFRSGSVTTVYLISRAKVIQMSVFQYFYQSILKQFIYYWSYAVLSFVLSVIFKTIAIPLSITLFLSLLGNQIISLLGINIELSRFLLPTSLEINSYIESPTTLQLSNQPVLINFAIILIYILLLLFLGCQTFVKQDI